MLFGSCALLILSLFYTLTLLDTDVVIGCSLFDTLGLMMLACYFVICFRI